MNRILICSLAALCLIAASAAISKAQEYQAPKVEISKEKVRYHGTTYYSHIVKEKQTIYSICKAYNVTQQELFDANPTLHLDTEGLKKNQILLIPIKNLAEEQESEKTPREEKMETVEKTVEEQKPENVSPQPSKDEYFFHTVKWYEDLNSIARKYKVSKLSIININGLQSQKVKRRQVLRIPRDHKKWENVTLTNLETAEKEPEEIKTSIEGQEESISEILSNAGNHQVRAAILMPFNISKTTDRQLVMDFYCGALMAARDLGMGVTFLDPASSQMGKKESLEDTAKVLGRMFDGIEYRGFDQQIVEDLAKHVRGAGEAGSKALEEAKKHALPCTILPYVPTGIAQGGSTDVGDVSWQTPTAQIYMGTWANSTPGHSWQVVAQGKSGLAHKAMLQAGKVLAATGLDLVLDPELVKKAQAELKERLQGETYVAIPKGVKPRGLSGAKN